MNKKDLSEKISAYFTDISINKAESIINYITIEITNQVKQNDPVKITGLGTFILKERKARTGVNPRTKEKINIPACKVVKFKASDTLKKAVKQGGV